MYMTAAFTGLRRGELLAVRWRDVDFEASAIRVRASYSRGALTMLKSGRARSVPMAPDVGRVLAQLGRREHFASNDDLVFAGEAGCYLDGSALRRRHDGALSRARLRPLRFHDLRHTFGTRIIARADIRRAQEWIWALGRPDDHEVLALRAAPRRCRARGGRFSAARLLDESELTDRRRTA
jgi:integrase